MAKSKTYSEKLKDPRWQRRRLEILSRSDFTCENPGCGSKTNTLHVHHLDYLPNAEPWEYSDEYLMALCEPCHALVSEQRPMYEKMMIQNYRLKIKDPFVQHCAGVVFGSYNNLTDLFFLLWEGEEHEILNLLKWYFNKQIPEQYLKPMEDAEQNTQRLDR